MAQAKFQSESQKLKSSEKFERAKTEFLQCILESSSTLVGVKPATSSNDAANYQSAIQEFSKLRGRDLYFPFLGSGLGNGPFVELIDGSVKFDMITGIGIHFFGHSHPELMKEILEAAPADVMQGNLEPGIEMFELSKALLERVGPKSNLKHAWLMCSGTMVNEVALKIIRQKKSPATKILAFKDCFAGRSTAMQEITDNPGYRAGQPVYGEVYYLPFYDDQLGLEKSLQNTLSVMKEHLTRFPGKFAALMMELIQGEGGFQFAPREFYVGLFEEAKKAGLAIWLDEIQTFGRTGELFAYQKFNLAEYVDVVTIGKMLQACAVLYTEEYNPKPGLVAGTFSGSTAALRTARRVLELMSPQAAGSQAQAKSMTGPEGHIMKLSRQFFDRLQELKAGNCKGMISEIRGIGGMIAFAPFGGTMDEVKSVLLKLYEQGVVAFYCGHGPYLVRLLPPLGAMNSKHVDEVCKVIEVSLNEVSSQRSRKS